MGICGKMNVTIPTGIRYRFADFSFQAAENCTIRGFDSYMGGGNTVLTDLYPL